MVKPVRLYLFISFFLTWLVCITCFLFYKAGDISLDTLNMAYNFGALGPFAGAFVSAKIYYGKDGIQKLLGTFRLSTLNKQSLLLSLSPLIFLVVGFLTYPLFKGHWYTFEDTRRQFALTDTASYIGWILPFITYSVFEEFGWRGFFLPHLQQKYTALQSSMLLTLFWASWHLPFFLWRFDFSVFITFGFFFSIFIGAIILTSAFNFSNGSILSTILFHFANNIASALDKEYIVAVVSTGFVFVAIYIVRRYTGENLADVVRVKNFYLKD
jgi:uncharacterized protein